MIEFRTGDILKTDAEAFVNTVNCVGIMGRGIALQFKNAFPENFKSYKEACDRHELQPGKLLVFETGRLSNPRYIINFPTKRHWKGKSRIQDIEAGLKALVHEIRQRRIHSVAIPPLGAGLGGLEWRAVRPRIETALRGLLDVRTVVFEPHAQATAPRVGATAAPKMTPGRAALVSLVRRYLDGLMDPFVTLLEVHKLLYFMQEAGQPLRLRYAKAPHGPYAENLRHVLQAVEGYMIAGFSDGGDAPGKRLQLVPGVTEEARAFLEGNAMTKRNLDRVAKLVTGFETPFGLELLSTTHWVVTKEGASDLDHAIGAIRAWGKHKAQFTPRQIDLAYDDLESKGWFASQRTQARE